MPPTEEPEIATKFTHQRLYGSICQTYQDDQRALAVMAPESQAEAPMDVQVQSTATVALATQDKRSEVVDLRNIIPQIKPHHGPHAVNLSTQTLYQPSGLFSLVGKPLLEIIAPRESYNRHDPQPAAPKAPQDASVTAGRPSPAQGRFAEPLPSEAVPAESDALRQEPHSTGEKLQMLQDQNGRKPPCVSVEMVRQFRILSPQGASFSKLDASGSFGSPFNLAVHVAMPRSYLTADQRVPEDVELEIPDHIVVSVGMDLGSRSR